MIEGPKPRLRGAHGTTTTGDEAEGRPNRIRGGSTRPRIEILRGLATRANQVGQVASGDNLSRRSGRLAISVSLEYGISIRTSGMAEVSSQISVTTHGDRVVCETWGRGGP